MPKPIIQMARSLKIFLVILILISLLKTVSEVSMEYLGVDQMDLNPVFIYENGLKIVDARIILKIAENAEK